MNKGIVIFWHAGQEYIEFDFENASSIAQVNKSKEHWDSGEKVTYNISPKVVLESEECTKIRIQYHQDKNVHVPPKGSLWGTSTITILKGEESGEAEWIDYDDDYQNGICRWYRVDAQVRSNKRRRITTTKLQRQQALFRRDLLAADQRCAITGEQIHAVLEAAHIVAVSEGGTDMPNNGLILRCDLHKLYDAGGFVIEPTGQLIPDQKICGEEYSTLLSSHRLNPATLKRVEETLEEKVTYVATQ